MAHLLVQRRKESMEQVRRVDNRADEGCGVNCREQQLDDPHAEHETRATPEIREDYVGG